VQECRRSVSIAAWIRVPPSALWFAAAPLLLAACAVPAKPEIDSVSPTHVAARTPAQLLISGDGFQTGDRVWLGATPLNASTWVNGRLLSARLPALPPGSYDLVVATADGRRVSKQSALVVQEAVATAARPSPSPAPVVRQALPTATTAQAQQVAATRTAPFDITGHWSLTDTILTAPGPPPSIVFADIALKQSGSSVSGAGNGIVSLRGTLSGRTLSASYIAYDKTQGEFVWTFSGDGATFSGTFTSSAPNSGNSNGRRLEAAP
jgi:hypothetical protein